MNWRKQKYEEEMKSKRWQKEIIKEEEKKNAKTNEEKNRPESIPTHSQQDQEDQHRTESHEGRDKTMKVYAMRDIKVGYMEPMLQQNDEIAIRTFQALIRSEKQLMSMYKQDIELWRIADYNETKGDILPDKEFLISGKDIKLIERN